MPETPDNSALVRIRGRCQQLALRHDLDADTLRLAEALGGEALTIPGVGRRIADDIINFAHANNVTQIIIGKSTRSRISTGLPRASR